VLALVCKVIRRLGFKGARKKTGRSCRKNAGFSRKKKRRAVNLEGGEKKLTLKKTPLMRKKKGIKGKKLGPCGTRQLSKKKEHHYVGKSHDARKSNPTKNCKMDTKQNRILRGGKKNCLNNMERPRVGDGRKNEKRTRLGGEEGPATREGEHAWSRKGKQRVI